MSEKKKTTRTISQSHLLFLIAGITLIVYYLVKNGVPSVSNNIVSLMKFIVEIFVLVLLIGFYFFFLFGAKQCQGTVRSIAPSLLILIVVGHYSMNFGNNAANNIITSIAEMCYLLIVVSGFVYLFIPNHFIGRVFCYSSLVYAAFVMVSYIVVLILSLVNSEAFSTAKLIETILYTGSLALLYAGLYPITRI